MERLLFEFVLRSGLIVLATAMVLRVSRIRSATAQHAVWVGVLVAMLALPLWILWGPKASLPLLPSRREPAAFSSAAPVHFADSEPTVPEPLEVVEGASKAGVPGRRAEWNWISMLNAILLGAYALGAGVLLLRLAIGTIRASRLSSAVCAAPVTVGLLRPRVILPECSSEWPQAQLDAVLAHEQAHVRRRDPLILWLALLNRALFWFHPAAWWLERRITGLAEEACDAAVLERGHDPRDYSAYLLDVARAVERAGMRVNVTAMAMPGSHLPQRIRKMMVGGCGSRVSRVRMAGAAATCAICSAMFAAGTLEQVRRAPVRTAGGAEIAGSALAPPMHAQIRIESRT